jgi:predicted ATP-dependent endonuclease of OLD family
MQSPIRSLHEFGPNDDRRKSFGWLGLMNNGLQPSDRERLIEDSLLINPALSAQFYSYLKNNWASVANSGVFRKIAKDISETSPEKYSDLTLEPFLANTFAFYALKDNSKRLRVGDLGEGIQNYLLARLSYETFKPNLLLWDDVESHFNPKILIKLSDWFSKLIAEGKQLVLATHSLEAIQLIAGNNSENTKILLVSLNNNILSTRQLSLTEIDEFRRAGIDVRTAESMLI